MREGRRYRRSGQRADETEQTRAGYVGESIAAALRARRLDAVEPQAVLEQAAVTLGVPVFLSSSTFGKFDGPFYSEADLWNGAGYVAEGGAEEV